MSKVFKRWMQGPATLLLALILGFAPGAQGAEPETAACAAAAASKPGTNCRNVDRPPVRVVSVPAPSPQGVGTLYNYVYCSPPPAGGASGADGKGGASAGKDAEQCKDQGTKIEVEVKGVKLKVDTRNWWIAGAALILAFGLGWLSIRAVAPSEAKAPNGESVASGPAFVVLITLSMLLLGLVAGYWGRGHVETTLTDQQLKELTSMKDFAATYNLASEATQRAEQLRLRVAELEKQLAVAQASAPSATAVRPVDGTWGWLTTALVAAALAALSTWSLLVARMGSMRNALDRMKASVSAVIVGLEGALSQKGPVEQSAFNLRAATTSALEILLQAQRSAFDRFD